MENVLILFQIGQERTFLAHNVFCVGNNEEL